MKNSKITPSIMLLIGGLLLLGVGILSFKALATSPTPDVSFRQKLPLDVTAELNILKELVQRKDLAGILQLQETLNLRWPHSSGEKSIVLAEICKNLNSVNFDDSRHWLYARQCSKSVLKNSNELAVDVEFVLLRILQEVEEYRIGILDPKLWRADREERIDFLFSSFERTQREYDPSFDFNDVKNIPSTRLCVPNSSYRCGIHPKDIKEPDLRARYLEDLERNKAKAQRLNRQRQIHRIIETLPHFIDTFITGMYRQKEFDEVALSKTLDRFDIHGDRRQRILDTAKGKNGE